MATIEEALNHGWKLHQGGQVRAAEDLYRQVLMVDGGNANGWCFLGIALHDQGRYDEAVTAYQQALRYRPAFPVALSNLGNTYKALGRLDDAVASCRASLKLKPDYHTAYNNLGVALVAQGKLEEAGECFEKALQYAPHDAVAHTNLSAALVRQGRLDEARRNSEEALRLNPAYAEAHKNQAIVWLLQGNFARGWEEYEWRWRCPGSAMPQFSRPMWDGTPLAGRTILLHAEQGLGDTMHFIRYAPLLRQRGARVVAQVQKPLLPLMRTVAGIDHLLEQGAPLPPFDVHAPLMSLPRLLGTELDTIPAKVPYLHADPGLVDRWRAELVKLPGLKVGIAWQGSAANQGDRQRSMALAQFAPLARLPFVTLVSLQKGLGSEQLTEIDFPVIDFGEQLDASGPFLDTAALMQSLDVVVTSDTSVAHLAGALGVPVWIALSYAPDWRWLLGRPDSPWYPTARLFRQPSLGDWDSVFQEIRQALELLPPRPTQAATQPVEQAASTRYDLEAELLGLCAAAGSLPPDKAPSWVWSRVGSSGSQSPDLMATAKRLGEAQAELQQLETQLLAADAASSNFGLLWQRWKEQKRTVSSRKEELRKVLERLG